MYFYRERLFLVNIVTLCLAVIVTMMSFVSFIPLLFFSIILLVSISMMADAIVTFLSFRQTEAILQFIRSILLLIIFIIIFVQYLLNRF